jgi:hypothetical protein
MELLIVQFSHPLVTSSLLGLNILLSPHPAQSKMLSYYMIMSSEPIYSYHSSEYLAYIYTSRIWGSHGGEYEDGCVLGCSKV